MALNYGPNITTNGLILSLDAADKNSYPGSGTTWYNSIALPNASLPSTSTYANNTMNYTYNYSNIGALLSAGAYDNTMEIWFYVPSGGSYAGCCDTIFGTYWFRTFLIGQTFFTMIGFYTGSGYIYQHPAYNISYDTWHCAVGMRRNGRYIIWIDGVELYNTDYGGSYSLYDAVGDWYISSSTHPNVKVTSARVYNRGLTDQELLQNYNIQKSRFGL
jgi:hypothetical protein